MHSASFSLGHLPALQTLLKQPYLYWRVFRDKLTSRIRFLCQEGVSLWSKDQEGHHHRRRSSEALIRPQVPFTRNLSKLNG